MPRFRSLAGLWRENSRAIPWIIFGVALIVRLIFVLSLDGNLSWDDEREFADISRQLAQGNGYVSPSYRANPVLPVYLGIVFRLFGENYVVARIGQALFGALTAMFIYHIGRKLGGLTTGFLSGMALALYPPHVYLAGVFYVECIATFLLTLSIGLALRAQEEGRKLFWALGTGMVVSLTALTRPVFLVILPCIPLAWWLGRQREKPRTRALLALFLTGATVTLVPWTYRNYVTFQRFMLVTSGFYTKLWQGNNVLANGGPDDRELRWDKDDWKQRLGKLEPQQRRELEETYSRVAQSVREKRDAGYDKYMALDEVLKPHAIRAVFLDPRRTISLFLRKTVTLYSAFSSTLTHHENFGPRTRLIAAFSYYPILFLALIGLVWGLPRWRELLLLYLVLGGVTVGYAALTACTRFRLPIDPILIIFSGLAIANFLGKRKPWESKVPEELKADTSWRARTSS